jgi:hypothetical protein
MCSLGLMPSGELISRSGLPMRQVTGFVNVLFACCHKGGGVYGDVEL